MNNSFHVPPTKHKDFFWWSPIHKHGSDMVLGSYAYGAISTSEDFVKGFPLKEKNEEPTVCFETFPSFFK